MGNVSSQPKHAKISDRTLVPSWFLAQACRLREPVVKQMLIDAGLKPRVIRCKKYDGPFIKESEKDSKPFFLFELSKAKDALGNRFGDRRIKWLMRSIDKLNGVPEEPVRKLQSLHSDVLLAIACVMDRIQLGVTPHDKAVEELKAIFAEQGIPWRMIPVDFKKELRIIAPVL